MNPNGRPRIPVEQRIWQYIEPADTGCWEWVGNRNQFGYGRIWIDKEHGMRVAHRVVYELLVGPVPAGLELDHLCRNRGCCNPEHVEPVTASVNVQRGDAASRQRDKTHCPQGHAYDAANTYHYPGKAGHGAQRMCRTCARERSRRIRANQRRRAQ